MRIKLSERIGFCFGVRRAVAMAERALEENRLGGICSLGPIIHNKEAVRDLAIKGLKVRKDIGKIKGGAVVVSSHGLSPKIKRAISKKGLKVIDTTCPFVLNAQRIAKRMGEEGYVVVIAGDANHPEIKALVDFVPDASGAAKVFVVKDKRKIGALKISHEDKVGVVAQTTQSTQNFLDVVKAIADKKPRELRVFNTICNDAEERQRLASCLAREVDLMLIVGGKNSANTKRLFEVCKMALKDSYLVETDKAVRRGWFAGKGLVGVISGASTPEWIIKKVVSKIKIQ
ncbi:MAG: 4-hydroxy-3-methylbut-2-enyl diphosphate reductase [Candidatus Omnitrophota bacterium]|nr:4-hydroxy-3-methylbut-2-enyl diphosphate reductase [Candidatus Omnitrophota bacterium]